MTELNIGGLESLKELQSQAHCALNDHEMDQPKLKLNYLLGDQN